MVGVARLRRAASRTCGRGRACIARRATELAELVHRENGKPVADALLEITLAVDHLEWAASHARKVLGRRRVPSGLTAPNQAAWLEYAPLGVVGVIGPWNYPVFTPDGLDRLRARGRQRGRLQAVRAHARRWARGWSATFEEAVPDAPVLSLVTGFGDTGAALCRSGVGKIAFTGSSRTGRKVMAACAEGLVPVLMECGGKDAMVVADDADIEQRGRRRGVGRHEQRRADLHRHRAGVRRRAASTTSSSTRSARSSTASGPARTTTPSYGPITMPGQVDVIEEHLARRVRPGRHGGRRRTGRGAPARSSTRSC